MVETREDLPFGLEAFLGELAAHVRAHELDRDLGVVLIVVAHRLEDVAHAAGAEHADDAIRAHAFADAARRAGRSGECLRAELVSHRIQERAGSSCASSSDCTSAISAASPPDSSVR